MKTDLKILAIQMTSGKDIAENIQRITELIEQAEMTAVDLVVLPEMFAQFGVKDTLPLAQAESELDGEVGRQLKALCLTHSVWMVAGTIPVLVPEVDRPRARCFVINPQGKVEIFYDKIHLFDASVSDKQGVYRESDSYSPGSDVVTFDSPWGRIGLAVCYDLRFPELFRKLADAGAQIVMLPSAFTYATGSAHWEVLCRARAIENGLFVVAVNQWGQHDSKRTTWGHSMLVNPWGEVDDVGEGEIAHRFTLNLNEVKEVRTQLPVHQHRRLG
jgi:nitrilase